MTTNHSPVKEKTVLLVDDDEALKTALSRILSKLGLRVLVAENGLAATTLLLNETVDLVLSDIQMPKMSGVDLTRYIKGAHPAIPVVLMTAFSDLLETKEAAELGAEAFFPKPFKTIELCATIQGLLNPAPPSDEPAEDQMFYSLSIDEFTSGRNIPYPIFLRIFEKRFIRLAHQGEDLDTDRILNYQSKGVRELYLTAEDFRAYVGFNLDLSSSVKNLKIDPAVKAKLLKHTGMILMEQIRQEGLQPETYQIAASFVKSTVELICSDPRILDILSTIQTHADHLYAHSVGVSTFSVMIARKLGWSLPANLFKIGMAGMLHDVGEKEIDRELLLKARVKLNAEEVKLYEQHSYRGLENVRTINTVPDDVLEVIKSHHENCAATGFPSKMRRDLIHPMAKLIAVADEFSKRIMKSPGYAGASPVDALREIQTFSSDLLDPQFFGTLMTLYGLDPPEPNRKRSLHGTS